MAAVTSVVVSSAVQKATKCCDLVTSGTPRRGVTRMLQVLLKSRRGSVKQARHGDTVFRHNQRRESIHRGGSRLRDSVLLLLKGSRGQNVYEQQGKLITCTPRERGTTAHHSTRTIPMFIFPHSKVILVASA